MPYDIHTLAIPDGATPPAWLDRLHFGQMLNQTNSAGVSAGAAVSTPVTWPVAGALPTNGETGSALVAEYMVDVEVNQGAVVSVQNKTASGFDVVMTPLTTSQTISAGTFNARVVF
jgi:hypothetical protein